MEEKNKERIIRAVQEKKLPIVEIASKLFMTERQLRLLLESWHVEIPRKRKLYAKVPPPERQVLMNLYKRYRNTGKVAEHFGVGINMVNRWMRDLNIPTRKMKMSKEEKAKFLATHVEKLNNINL